MITKAELKTNAADHVIDQFDSELHALRSMLGATNPEALAEQARERFGIIKTIAEAAAATVRANCESARRFNRLLTHSRTLYANWYAIWERMAALREVNGSAAAFVSANQDLGSLEARRTGIATGSRICYVGSGPFPWTAMMYAIQTGCRVACLDMNAESMRVAKQVIACRGLSDQIDVICDIGELHHYRGYTHVVVAAMANPKSDIIEAIKDSAGHGTTILTRTAIRDDCPFYPRWRPALSATDRDWTVIPQPGAGELETLCFNIVTSDRAAATAERANW